MPATRPIILPSGGRFGYPSIAELSDLTIETKLNFVNPELCISETHFIYLILKNHLHNIDPLDITYEDGYFIKTYLLNAVSAATSLKMNSICKACNNMLLLETPIEEITIKYLKKDLDHENYFIDPLTQKKYTSIKEIDPKKEYIIKRNRTMRDSIETFNSFLDIEDSIEKIQYFVEKSIDIYPNKERNEDMIIDYVRNLRMKDLMWLFSQSRKIDYGIINDHHYICKKCNTENKVMFADPYFSCFFIPPSVEKKSEFFEYIKTSILMASIGGLPYSDYKQVCIAHEAALNEAISESIKIKTLNVGSKSSSGKTITTNDPNPSLTQVL